MALQVQLFLLLWLLLLIQTLGSTYPGDRHIHELPKNATTPRLNRKPPLNDPAKHIVIPFPFPLFSQCEMPWKNNIMVNKTICQVGCLMSSTSMGLAGSGIKTIQGQAANPGSLNRWLQTHNGYIDGDDMIESKVAEIDPQRIAWTMPSAFHRTNDLPFKNVTQLIAKGTKIVIGNVNHGGHFVLLVGWNNKDRDTIYVNDPGFDRQSYSYSRDIVGYRIFDVKRRRSEGQ